MYNTMNIDREVTQKRGKIAMPPQNGDDILFARAGVLGDKITLVCH